MRPALKRRSPKVLKSGLTEQTSGILRDGSGYMTELMMWTMPFDAFKSDLCITLPLAVENLFREKKYDELSKVEM